jgi:hypothetical protein
MAKHVKKVRGRTTAWLVVVAMMVLAGISVGQLASATTSGGTGGTTTTTDKSTTTTVAPTTTVKPTTTTQAGGPLPFTGAASLPMLFGALALLGLGATSLLAATRRRRRA